MIYSPIKILGRSVCSIAALILILFGITTIGIIEDDGCFWQISAVNTRTIFADPLQTQTSIGSFGRIYVANVTEGYQVYGIGPKLQASAPYIVSNSVELSIH